MAGQGFDIGPEHEAYQYTVSFEGYDPDDPFAIAEVLNERLTQEASNREFREVQEASNNELRDMATIAHAAHQVVWNSAVRALNAYGSPLRTDIYDRGPKPIVYTDFLTTGLVELRGVTGDITPEVAAISIKSPYNVRPKPIDGIPEHKPFDVSAEVMDFAVYMARPSQEHAKPSEFMITETPLPKSLWWWTNGALTAASKLRRPRMEALVDYANYPGAEGSLDVSDTFKGRIIRPEMPAYQGNLTDRSQVEAAARKHLERYNQMNVLYNYIGAMATPLRDDPRFKP